jgi:hypothetical protein
VAADQITKACSPSQQAPEFNSASPDPLYSFPALIEFTHEYNGFARILHPTWFSISGNATNQALTDVVVLEKEHERKRKRKTLLGEKKEVCSKRV